MNATNFVVLLILIGVVCANVGARQLQEVPKDTKLGITIPQTSTTNGIGAELVSVVTVYSNAYSSRNINSNANAGPGRPSAGGSGSGSAGTSGYVVAKGPNANGYSSSSANSQGRGNASASPGGATGDGTGFGYASTNAGGSVSP